MAALFLSFCVLTKLLNAQLSVTALIQPPDAAHILPKLPANQKNDNRFRKVADSRGDAIRGLWQRNGRFYAQLRSPGKHNALVDADGVPLRSVAQARAALENLRAKRRTNSLPPLTRTPPLSNQIDRYVRWLRSTQTKHSLTIAKESGALAKWNEL